MRKKAWGKPAALLLGAAVLLAGSTAGSARAALTYYSENYSAQVSISRIGVSLLENGEIISSRDYTEENDWVQTSGALLENLLGEGEKLILGKTYDNVLQVNNSGSIDTFVRAVVKKSWTDPQGDKDTSLDPEMIELDFLTDNGWMIDEDASTRERTVLYYDRLLMPGESTLPLADCFRISKAVGTKVNHIEKKTEEGTIVTTAYAYDGYGFQIEVEADAVQTHNAADAIKSAWGVDVTVSDDGTRISLQ